jgi:1,4-alpha-glucan branching enzyme
VYLGDGKCRFRVWASKRERVDLHITAPADRHVPMQPMGAGYFEVPLDDIEPGTRYVYRLDGGDERPDPASRYQPTTVREPSAVVETDFPRTTRRGTVSPPELITRSEVRLALAPTSVVAYSLRVEPPTHR